MLFVLQLPVLFLYIPDDMRIADDNDQHHRFILIIFNDLLIGTPDVLYTLNVL